MIGQRHPLNETIYKSFNIHFVQALAWLQNTHTHGSQTKSFILAPVTLYDIAGSMQNQSHGQNWKGKNIHRTAINEMDTYMIAIECTSNENIVGLFHMQTAFPVTHAFCSCLPSGV